MLRFAGAAYLVGYGVRVLVRAARRRAQSDAGQPPVGRSPWRAARMGLATNLLNPKIGIFYVALLPQFVPVGSDPLAVGLLLAGVHAMLSLVWFAGLVGLASGLSGWLRRPATARTVDGVTGVTLVGFGMRLALSGP